VAKPESDETAECQTDGPDEEDICLAVSHGSKSAIGTVCRLDMKTTRVGCDP